MERIKGENRVNMVGLSDRPSPQQGKQASNDNAGPNLFKIVMSVLLVVLAVGIFMLLFSMDKKLKKLDN